MERGYHAFYFLLRGAPEYMLKKLFLTDAKGTRKQWKDFFYLKDGGDLSEKHDVDGWKEIDYTIKNLKFTD